MFYCLFLEVKILVSMMQGCGEGSDGERDSVKAVIYIYRYIHIHIYMDKDM